MWVWIANAMGVTLLVALAVLLARIFLWPHRGREVRR